MILAATLDSGSLADSVDALDRDQVTVDDVSHAVGALHLAGRHDTTEATRWASRNLDRPFTILGLTPRSETAVDGCAAWA